MDTVVEAKVASFTHAKSTRFRSHASPAGMSSFSSSVSCFQLGLSTPVGDPGVATAAMPNLGEVWLPFSVLGVSLTLSFGQTASAIPGSPADRIHG
eukprot:11214001-Lingulodinium_polyedra.AAC.1